MQRAMQPMKSMDACEWCTVEVLRIFTQDMGLNQFRFFNMVHDILVKVKLEVTRTSIILNMFGSRRRSDVTRFIFCPNFAGWLLPYFNLTWWTFFVKAWAWFNPVIQGMEILIANTSTTSHRDEWLGPTLSLCTENVIMKLRCPKKHHFLVNHALGTMFNYFVLLLCVFFFLEMGLWSQHGWLMVPNTCN